jgi:hypothetical protein
MLYGAAPPAPLTTELIEQMLALAGPGAGIETHGDHYRLTARTPDDMLPGLNYRRENGVYYCTIHPSDINLIESNLRELKE